MFLFQFTWGIKTSPSEIPRHCRAQLCVCGGVMPAPRILALWACEMEDWNNNVWAEDSCLDARDTGTWILNSAIVRHSHLATYKLSATISSSLHYSRGGNVYFKILNCCCKHRPNLVCNKEGRGGGGGRNLHLLCTLVNKELRCLDSASRKMQVFPFVAIPQTDDRLENISIFFICPSSTQ